MEEITEIVSSWLFKLIAGTVFTTMVGWLMLSIRNTAKKIKEAPTKLELEKGITDAKNYADKKLREHEKLHKSIEDNFSDIKEDNVRIETKVDKILFLLANNK